MKKRILILAAVMACIMMTTIPSFAVTKEIKFVFLSTKPTQTTEVGKKNDSEPNYYITISEGNVSESNVFGTRIRRVRGDAMVSPYITHKAKEKSVPYAYSSTVNTIDSYYLKGKKDTCSTSILPLAVTGKVTY